MVAGYQVGAVYNLDSYISPSYTGATNRATLYLAGASLVGPNGSNLPAPAPVGRYGAFNKTAALSNLTGTTTSTESKQLPMRIGKAGVFISFTTLSRGGAGGLVPSYGN